MEVPPQAVFPLARTGLSRSAPLVLALACVATAALAAGGNESSNTPAADAAVQAAAPLAAQAPADAPDPHADLLKTADGMFPSAKTCAVCHPQIFDEWSTSQHAYAAISPMFHRFEQAINELASGTVGAFCVRCHIPVGTTLGEKRETPLWDRAPISTEGISCVVCHRVNEDFGRVNGERSLVKGSLFQPVYGTTGAPDLAQLIGNADNGLTADPNNKGLLPIHGGAVKNDTLSKSAFCVSCHQVAVHPGIKLEVVWEQYRDSPAAAADVSCQDCHMGKNPGTAEGGYMTGPRAVLPGGTKIKDGSRHTDHAFVGPGYAIAHPGIFPSNRTAPESFTIKRWMTFDWRAGWGDEEFEKKQTDAKESAVQFPEEWKNLDDRRDARRIVNENLASLARRNVRRSEIMERASRVDGPFFEGELKAGTDLNFHMEVSNVGTGHNYPSGSLGAQPEIWLNVALVDPDGVNVWESGFVDSHGDMADLHSHDVLEGKIEPDHQLFNLQTKFLTTNLKGTDREMYLPVPFDADQLPYIRPPGTPNSIMNHPPTIRMEQRSIPPLSSRKANYSVPASKMTKSGTYKLAVRLRSRAEPIYFMEFVGATKEMIREMNAQMIDIHPYTVAFEVR